MEELLVGLLLKALAVLAEIALVQLLRTWSARWLQPGATDGADWRPLAA